MNEKIYCPMCEAEHPFRREVVREEYEIRGEKFTLEIPRLFCSHCGESIIDEALGDPTLHLYAAYRRRHNLLMPDEIRGIREKYDLSQAAFAALLGASPATLARYEGGSLQDKAYDQLLRACDNPIYMTDLLQREGGQLSASQLRKSVAKLEHLKNGSLMAAFPECRELDIRKYASVMAWFCQKIKTIVQTKMYKLLFYSDFISYVSRGHSITGAHYRRLPYGPVPSQYDTIQSILEADNMFEMREVFYPNCSGLAYKMGTAAPNPCDVLTADECRVLEFVLETFGRLNAKEISDRSHKEPAWMETASNALIPYHYARRLSVQMPTAFD